jgi:chitinase
MTNNLSDEETFADKKAWADGYCFGGTMVWSIDFQEQYAMSTPVILSR